jgi:hypothetical protein
MVDSRVRLALSYDELLVTEPSHLAGQGKTVYLPYFKHLRRLPR